MLKKKGFSKFWSEDFGEKFGVGGAQLPSNFSDT